MECSVVYRSELKSLMPVVNCTVLQFTSPSPRNSNSACAHPPSICNLAYHSPDDISSPFFISALHQSGAHPRPSIRITLTSICGTSLKSVHILADSQHSVLGLYAAHSNRSRFHKFGSAELDDEHNASCISYEQVPQRDETVTGTVHGDNKLELITWKKQENLRLEVAPKKSWRLLFVAVYPLELRPVAECENELYCTTHKLHVSEQNCKILVEQSDNKCELHLPFHVFRRVRDKAVQRKIILFVTVLLKD